MKRNIRAQIYMFVHTEGQRSNDYITLLYYYRFQVITQVVNPNQDIDRTKARTPKCRPAFGCSRRALPGPNKKSAATKFMVFASPENVFKKSKNGQKQSGGVFVDNRHTP